MYPIRSCRCWNVIQIWHTHSSELNFYFVVEAFLIQNSCYIHHLSKSRHCTSSGAHRTHLQSFRFRIGVIRVTFRGKVHFYVSQTKYLLHSILIILSAAFDSVARAALVLVEVLLLLCVISYGRLESSNFHSIGPFTLNFTDIWWATLTCCPKRTINPQGDIRSFLKFHHGRLQNLNSDLGLEASTESIQILACRTYP